VDNSGEKKGETKKSIDWVDEKELLTERIKFIGDTAKNLQSWMMSQIQRHRRWSEWFANDKMEPSEEPVPKKKGTEGKEKEVKSPTTTTTTTATAATTTAAVVTAATLSAIQPTLATGDEKKVVTDNIINVLLDKKETIDDKKATTTPLAATAAGDKKSTDGASTTAAATDEKKKEEPVEKQFAYKFKFTLLQFESELSEASDVQALCAVKGIRLDRNKSTTEATTAVATNGSSPSTDTAAIATSAASSTNGDAASAAFDLTDGVRKLWALLERERKEKSDEARANPSSAYHLLDDDAVKVKAYHVVIDRITETAKALLQFKANETQIATERLRLARAKKSTTSAPLVKKSVDGKSNIDPASSPTGRDEQPEVVPSPPLFTRALSEYASIVTPTPIPSSITRPSPIMPPASAPSSPTDPVSPPSGSPSPQLPLLKRAMSVETRHRRLPGRTGGVIVKPKASKPVQDQKQEGFSERVEDLRA
jgi:hypothetical protein